MSLARTVLHSAVRAPSVAYPLAARRLASTATHDEHHHDEHHDETVYPPEGFHSRWWIYSVIGFAGIAVFYKYAPAPGEESRITRWIKSLAPEHDWKSRNDGHLALASDTQDAVLTIQSARRPPIYRMKYPQQAQMALPFSVPVGHEVDFSGVRVKGDREY
ncbi:hypothetical protein K488DRAFT_87460 [Vararia minispora EC-137]|uniref:Uncharacterized protein n=1 Tax=Vararia minispora EC-137 TaxID=1314806 RepID=A0ACB8QGB2_9AGAM|nr:hypothetical protein K488DRAFT_87460 [Vararia minispora EC-137]